VEKPAIKGSIFRSVVGDLQRLVEEGRITEEEIGARLGAEGLACLESEINAAAWYPIETYARIMQLLGDVEGGGEEKYFLERGRANARRLMEAGLYGQLDYLTRWKESMLEGDRGDESAVIARYASSLKLIVSLASNIYNVGEWAVASDRARPRRVWITIRHASDYSEPMRLAIEGFLNECGSKHTETTQLYRSERPAPDLILFRMNYDIMDLLEG
jgi:hypothetical protein